jgi:hypothetical protein
MTRAALLARSAVAGTTITRTPLSRTTVAWTAISGATTSASATTATWPLRIFRSAFVRSLIYFLESPLIEGQTLGRIFEFVIACGLIAAVDLGLALVARSFVAHRGLPIHRCRGSSRTGSSSSTSSARRASALSHRPFGRTCFGFVAFLELVDLCGFFAILETAGAVLFRVRPLFPLVASLLAR